MRTPITRRGLLGGSAGLAAMTSARLSAQTRGVPGSGVPGSGDHGPVVIASGNGLRGVALAREQILAGADPLDAAIAGVNIQEMDPEDQSVGLGGLPNEEGVVQLDASCMHGPSKRAGAVGALEGIAEAALVAQAVMERTDHIFLVGEGAKRFALQLGFQERELLTEKSRAAWLRWKTRLSAKDNWLELDEEELESTTGTINMCALDGHGDLGSVTTTSGLSWKIPGRVGDSPVVGAGQYCDNAVGAAGSTGRGEANIQVCGAFLTVEHMRQGGSPEEACLRTIQRVIEATEDRLLEDGKPLFSLNFYALGKDGAWGGATLYEPTSRQRERSDRAGKMAVADDQGPRLVEMATMYRAAERPESMRR